MVVNQFVERAQQGRLYIHFGSHVAQVPIFPGRLLFFVGNKKPYALVDRMQRTLEIEKLCKLYGGARQAQTLNCTAHVGEVLGGERTLEHDHLTHFFGQVQFLLQGVVVGAEGHLRGHLACQCVAALGCEHFAYAVESYFMFYIGHCDVSKSR